MILSTGCTHHSGFGIRSQGQVTPMFEALVAKVFQVSPKSKLLFNTLPGRSLYF